MLRNKIYRQGAKDAKGRKVDFTAEDAKDRLRLVEENLHYPHLHFL
jgi:hypothetical protein